MNDVLARIQTEARGTNAHGLIVEYLKAKRFARLEQLASVPKDELLAVQSDVRLLDELLRDLLRELPKAKDIKTGAYTV